MPALIDIMYIFKYMHVNLIEDDVVLSVVYACESWTLTAELQRRIQAMEMR